MTNPTVTVRHHEVSEAARGYTSLRDRFTSSPADGIQLRSLESIRSSNKDRS